MAVFEALVVGQGARKIRRSLKPSPFRWVPNVDARQRCHDKPTQSGEGLAIFDFEQTSPTHVPTVGLGTDQKRWAMECHLKFDMVAEDGSSGVTCGEVQRTGQSKERWMEVVASKFTGAFTGTKGRGGRGPHAASSVDAQATAPQIFSGAPL